jgi:hypothetical protein
MGTYTSRLGLFLPAGTDAADIATIVAAWNKLDKTSGLILCTSSTRPTTNLFPGLFIKETDTRKHYYLDNTGTWSLGTYTGGTWIEDFYLTLVSGGNVFYGAGINTPYAIGFVGGNPASSAENVEQNVLIDIGVATTFTVPAAGNVKVDINATVGPFNQSHPYIQTNTGNVLGGQGTYCGVDFSLYEGSTLLGVFGGVVPDRSYYLSNDGAASQKLGETFNGSLVVYLATSGAHTLTCKATTRMTNQMGTAGWCLNVLANIQVTI